MMHDDFICIVPLVVGLIVAAIAISVIAAAVLITVTCYAGGYRATGGIGLAVRFVVFEVVIIKVRDVVVLYWVRRRSLWST